MIAYLQGSMMAIDSDRVLLTTSGGVGYEVYFRKRPLPTDISSLFITTIVKENSLELYGLSSLQQKRMFELLLTVKGVGPKSAYNLLSTLDEKTIVRGIQNEDRTLFKGVPGVGPKIVAQIILDLKEKIKKIGIESSTSLHRDEIPTSKAMDEALLAFKQLGWSEERVLPVMQKVMQKDKNYNAEELVQLVFKTI